MRLTLKVLGLALALAALFLAGFALWGEAFERLFSQEACVQWFQEIRPYAWAVAIGLLVGDLVLPVPATGVMAALGSVYGAALGAVIGATGSMLSGLAGYGLARWGGKPLARRLADEAELARFQAFFDRWGGWAVILSRMLPVLPEVMAVLAGLARMRFGRFVAALALGTLPTVVLYAWLGHASRDAPWWGMLVAVMIPMLVWPVFLRFVARRGS
jgi:uncharacterized membrane protein YdjX (TVP38/TMEM64 family)